MLTTCSFLSCKVGYVFQKDSLWYMILSIVLKLEGNLIINLCRFIHGDIYIVSRVLFYIASWLIFKNSYAKKLLYNQLCRFMLHITLDIFLLYCNGFLSLKWNQVKLISYNYIYTYDPLNELFFLISWHSKWNSSPFRIISRLVY